MIWRDFGCLIIHFCFGRSSNLNGEVLFKVEMFEFNEIKNSKTLKCLCS